MMVRDVQKQRFAGSQILEAALKGLSTFPFAKLATSREPLVLLYHGVPQGATIGEIGAEAFERQIRYLTSRFQVIAHDHSRPRRPFEKLRVVLTFDDGFRNNAEVVAPILRKYQAPAMFFVCSRHITTGGYLWVSYIDALNRFYPHAELRLGGQSFDMRPHIRRRSVEHIRTLLRSLRPHPSAIYEAIEKELPPITDFVTRKQLRDRYAGMTEEQLGELAADPLFTIGGHTADHPFLSNCEQPEIERQIRENLELLNRITGRKHDTIAYPSGDYDERVIRACAEMRISAGFAVSPKFGRRGQFEIPRMGVYNGSEAVLGFKVQWGNYLRAARLAIG